MMGAALFSLSSPVFSQQVHSIKSSGILELENGDRVTLAGIRVPEESMNSLSVILTKKEVSWEEEKSFEKNPAASVKSVYLYVNNQELDFPFKSGSAPRTKKVMVNEWLLSLGLARVDGEKLFRHKEAFLELEAEANRRGMGIWSYEPIPAKKLK